MTGTNVLNPNPPEFERFLYASVGEDRNGYAVTVLSALARLGFDPWKQTAELSTVGREAAAVRLGGLLSNFWDVPSLAIDHGTVARRLSQLLPDVVKFRSFPQTGQKVAIEHLPSRGAVVTALALVFVVVQMLFIVAPGPSE